MAFTPFIGEICIWPFDFAPRGWVFCEGQVLSIAQHPQLYGLLGNSYGGDVPTTFALPDLRGRTVVGVGTGPGLSTYQRADRGGVESVPLEPQEAAAVVAPAPAVGFSAHRAAETEVPVVQPYVAMNYIIALEGIFPSRN